MAKSPFDLHMHEDMSINRAGETCLRVPGGWIYTIAVHEVRDSDPLYQAVHVPWSERVETECVHREAMLSAGK